MRTQLHEQNQVLLKRQQHVGHLRRTIDDDQDKNGTVHLELLRLKQDAIKHERESADDAARILALREDIQAQSRQLEKLRDTLATQRLQEVDYANEVCNFLHVCVWNPDILPSRQEKCFLQPLLFCILFTNS